MSDNLPTYSPWSQPLVHCTCLQTQGQSHQWNDIYAYSLNYRCILPKWHMACLFLSTGLDHSGQSSRIILFFFFNLPFASKMLVSKISTLLSLVVLFTLNIFHSYVASTICPCVQLSQVTDRTSFDETAAFIPQFSMQLKTRWSLSLAHYYHIFEWTILIQNFYHH